jgi:hypothetical protein
MAPSIPGVSNKFDQEQPPITIAIAIVRRRY